MNIVADQSAIDTIADLVAEKVLAKIEATPEPSQPQDERFAYTESDAAEKCGLAVHQLREQRRLGRIVPCKAKPGRRILYTPEAIRDFLDGRYLDKTADNGSAD